MISITKTQERIMTYLLENPENPPTIRALARNLNTSYALTYNNLKVLEKEDIVEKDIVPPVRLVHIKPGAPTELLVYLEMKRAEDFMKKHPWCQVMLQDILSNTALRYFTLIIFGSYARSKQTRHSDLDLLGVVPRREDVDELDNALRKSYTKVRKNIVIVAHSDFREMLKDPRSFTVGTEAKKYHLLLYGAEQFYHL